MSDELKYSLVVPIYRDADLLEDFCIEFQRVFIAFLGKEQISEDVELIVVCDGGGRKDEDTVRTLCNRFAFLRAILLSRNFGQHVALTAGYNAATGAVVGILNVDQQDPIDELPKFLMHLQAEHLDIVYGLREERKGLLVDRLTSTFFHIILDKFTGSETPANISTMRVMSRRFVDAYNGLNESERYLPGLEHWLGFDVGYVDTIHRDRAKGESSYTFNKRLKMAVNSILGFSDYPLRLMASFGFIVSFIGIVGVVLIVFMKIFFVDFQAGYPSLVSLIILFSGAIISSVGFGSLYVGRVLREVQRRPTYIAKEKIKLP